MWFKQFAKFAACVATYLNLPINGINNDWHITHEALCLSTVESFSIRYMKKTYQYYDIFFVTLSTALINRSVAWN